MKKFLQALTGKGGAGEAAADPKNDRDFYESLQTDVLARTLWGEARGEEPAGMEAVARVILNRAAIAIRKGGYWWGNDIITVCQKPYQFSCWNRSDPNYRKLLDIDAKDIHFATALRIARRAVAGVLADPTNGATHYHADSILPDWAKGQTPSARIGRHIFYNLIEA